MKLNHALLLLACLPALPVSAQVFGPNEGTGGGQPAESNNTTIVNQSAPQTPRQTVGNEIPFMDPGSELASWDGHTWNVSNNRLFRARFEKYLAAPEENGPADAAYRATLIAMMDALSPNRKGGPSLAASVKLLPEGSKHPIDARICDSIAQAVYGVVQYKKHVKHLQGVNEQLEKDAHNQSWNFEVAQGAAATRAKMDKPTQTSGGGGNGSAQANADTNQAAADASRVTRYVKKIVEIDAMKVANAAKITAGELKAKVEFQALVLQLFLQRRFEHCIIASRMYRSLFEDGDTELKLKEGSDVEKTFVRTTGATPTISALDALSSEMIRDADEGVKAFEYYLEKSELDSASKRLGEAFMIGEYLPRLRTLPRTSKERVIQYVRDSNQLLSAVEVKDYGLVEELTEKLRKEAKDFDFSKPRAAVEVARASSALHIQQARSAAIARDDKKAAEHIHQAALIWPTNPDLKAFSSKLAASGDTQQQLLQEFDSLYAQKNYQQIFSEAFKYSAAIAATDNPSYKTRMEEVAKKMSGVKTAVTAATIMKERGDTCGAWEQLDTMAKDHPDDVEINRMLKDLAPMNPDFISAISKARDLETNQAGVAMAWYLRARKLYPNSTYARDGINRLKKVLTGEAAALSSPAAATVPVTGLPPTQ